MDAPELEIPHGGKAYGLTRGSAAIEAYDAKFPGKGFPYRIFGNEDDAITAIEAAIRDNQPLHEPEGRES